MSDKGNSIEDAGEHQEASPIELAQRELDADIMLLNAPIAPGLSTRVRAIVDIRPEKRKNLIVIVVSSGGVADDAYRTAMALRSGYERVIVCVAGWCKSAATLMAIAADELIFGCYGEMGPLDVQIAVKDELVDNRDSGLILDAAVNGLTDNAFKVFEKFMTSIIERSQGAITFRTAAHLAADVTVGLMAPIFEKIDPLRMGADRRAQNIGMHYAFRLNMKSENLSGPEALNMLLNGYPSHGFAIDIDEARLLFTNVKPLDGHLKTIVERLGKLARFPEDEPVVCYLDGDEDGESADTAEPSAGRPEADGTRAEADEQTPSSEELRGTVQAGSGSKRKTSPR